MALCYVVDGNFTAQHMNMRKPEGDVALADGLGYMVEDTPYQNHVASVSRINWFSLGPIGGGFQRGA